MTTSKKLQITVGTFKLKNDIDEDTLSSFMADEIKTEIRHRALKCNHKLVKGIGYSCCPVCFKKFKSRAIKCDLLKLISKSMVLSPCQNPHDCNLFNRRYRGRDVQATFKRTPYL